MTKRVRRIKRKEDLEVKGVPRKFDGRGRVNVPTVFLEAVFGEDFTGKELYVYGTEDEIIISTEPSKPLA